LIAPKDGKEREGDEEVMTNGRAVKREDPENPGVFLALRLDRDAFRELHESQPCAPQKRAGHMTAPRRCVKIESNPFGGERRPHTNFA
jgi:hypothetical protein